MGIDVAFVARDRFSTSTGSLKAICASLPSGSFVYIGDAGYPPECLLRLTRLCAAYGVSCRIVDVGLHANTNHAWNVILRLSRQDPILYIENDVEVSASCIASLAELLKGEGSDIAVAAIFEADGTTVHFCPAISEIQKLAGGGYRVILDRGRDARLLVEPGIRDSAQATSRIDIFERHCFLVNRRAGEALGDLDELMFCRTDLDLSLACKGAGLRISLVSGATAELIADFSATQDVEFFRYRWDLHRVEQANDRLIAKWGLVGYKRAIAHAHHAQARLAALGLSD